jgi:hypothetical protein
MPRYVPRGPIEAHRRDEGDEYLLLEAGGRFLGALDASLFELVFTLEPDTLRMAGDVLDGRRPIEDVLEELRPPEPPGKPLVPDDLVPASEKLAATIAARTVPGGPAATLPRSPAELERILEETRVQVDQEQRERARNGGEGPPDPKAGKPYGTKLKPGESAGRGRRVCVRKLESGELCNTVNPIAGRGAGNGAPCWGCGKPVKVVKR